jgi:transcriptional regulator with XRE-family HTH domain
MKQKIFAPIESVRMLRKSTGLNQSDFWNKIGVTQSGGSRYESGRLMPKAVRTLVWLTYIYWVKTDHLFKHMNSVKDVFRLRILKSKLNQTDFWAKVGVTQSGGSRYENGRTPPVAVRALLRAVYVLKLDLNALTKGPARRSAAKKISAKKK